MDSEGSTNITWPGISGGISYSLSTFEPCSESRIIRMFEWNCANLFTTGSVQRTLVIRRGMPPLLLVAHRLGNAEYGFFTHL